MENDIAPPLPRGVDVFFFGPQTARANNHIRPIIHSLMDVFTDIGDYDIAFTHIALGPGIMLRGYEYTPFCLSVTWIRQYDIGLQGLDNVGKRA